MTKRIVAAVAFAMVLASSACSGDSSSRETSRCVSVSDSAVKAISKEIESPITDAAAVKSKDFKNVFMVAGKIEGGTGVWATNGDPSAERFLGAVQAVDGMAQEFSTWPEADADATTDGVDEAKSCL